MGHLNGAGSAILTTSDSASQADGSVAAISSHTLAGLALLPIHVPWREEERTLKGGNKKSTKVPYSARGPGKAKADVPIPLYRAAAEGLIRVVQHGRGTRLVCPTACSTTRAAPARRSSSGTTTTKPPGPAGGPQAAALLRWARVVILHGASAEPVHYGMAAAGALARRRALMVETDAAHLDAWIELTKKAARPETHVSVVAMAPGLVHPRRSAPPGATVK